jgi:hypothetical protein
MPYWDFLWTPPIEAHLAEHGVTPEEFEQVVSSPWDVKPSRRTGFPMARGETNSGRYLICIYKVLEDGVTVEPVTAFEPDETP